MLNSEEIKQLNEISDRICSFIDEFNEKSEDKRMSIVNKIDIVISQKVSNIVFCKLDILNNKINYLIFENDIKDQLLEENETFFKELEAELLKKINRKIFYRKTTKETYEIILKTAKEEYSTVNSIIKNINEISFETSKNFINSIREKYDDYDNEISFEPIFITKEDIETAKKNNKCPFYTLEHISLLKLTNMMLDLDK